MDQEKFGIFIAALRKEKGWTQRELAEYLNVTDKAVSKWERGLGFPDIKTIEPLADALDVSVLEIMRAERMDAKCVSTDGAEEAITNVIDAATYQRKIGRKNMIIALIAVTALVMMCFLIDAMEWIGFIMVCLPVILLATGILLLIVGLKRWRQKEACAPVLILGIVAMMFPVMLCVLLSFAFMLGGPVPS